MVGCSLSPIKTRTANSHPSHFFPRRIRSANPPGEHNTTLCTFSPTNRINALSLSSCLSVYGRNMNENRCHRIEFPLLYPYGRHPNYPEEHWYALGSSRGHGSGSRLCARGFTYSGCLLGRYANVGAVISTMLRVKLY